jgi:hypothetical protein
MFEDRVRDISGIYLRSKNQVALFGLVVDEAPIGV